MPNLAEIWHYRELAGFLAWRDISTRYKQTLFGAAWALAQPLTLVLTFSMVFGRMVKIPTDGAPYPLFSFAAMLPWQYVFNASSYATNSLFTSAPLLTKVYFPRAVIPLASILPPVLDLMIALAFLGPMMLAYHMPPTPKLLLLPVFLLLAVVTALGIGMWNGAVGVKYRDVRYLQPLLMQLLLFVSPVVYSSMSVPEKWRLLYALNPMVAVINGFRWCIIDSYPLFIEQEIIGSIVGVALFISALMYFSNVERKFADLV